MELPWPACGAGGPGQRGGRVEVTVRVTSYTVAAAGTAAGAPAPVAGSRRDRAHSAASRVTTSASAIRNSAATHASTLVIEWPTENRSIAGPAPWLVAHAKPIRAPIPTTPRIAAAPPGPPPAVPSGPRP